MVNAEAESALRPDAAGDCNCRTSTTRTFEYPASKCSVRACPTGRTCRCMSYGYWQLNTLGGEGIDYWQWLDTNSGGTFGPRYSYVIDFDPISSRTVEDQAKMIFNEENQFRWVSWRLKEIFDGTAIARYGGGSEPGVLYSDQSISPLEWSSLIAKFFEDCLHCGGNSSIKAGTGDAEQRRRAAMGDAYARGDLLNEVGDSQGPEQCRGRNLP